MLMLALFACKPAADDLTEPPPPDERCADAPLEVWRGTETPRPITRAFAQEMERLGAEGVAWAVLVDGEIRYAGASGFADEPNGVPMEPTTLLRNGSTLKMQTAAAVLAQEAVGTLSRDDRLSDHLPDFSMRLSPGVAEAATVHELISHQGGFYDWTPIDGPAGESALYNQAHDVLAEEYYMLAPPGSFYNYSNPNFSMAGLIAEQASGTPYRELMRDTVWAPLCMDRTFFEAGDVLADGDWAAASTTNWETGIGTERVGPESYDHGFSAPAGFAWTSVLDMLRFADFLLEGNEAVMPRALSDAISTGQVDTLDLPDGVVQYGYGLTINAGYSDGGWRDSPLWHHNGAIPGYAADLYIHPDSGVAVAILSNTDGAYFVDGPLTVLDQLTDSPIGTAPAPGVDMADFPGFVGTYDDPFNVGTFEVSIEGTALVVTAPDLDGAGVPYSSTLTPYTRGNFLMTIDGFQLVLTFVEQDGEARWIRNRIFVLERRTAAPQSFRLDPVRLRRHLRALPPRPPLVALPASVP